MRDRAELVITANGDKPKPDPIPVTPVPTPVGKPASNSTNTEGGAELPFRDVTRNNWFFDDVKYVYSQGIMDGVGAEQFAPRLTELSAGALEMLPEGEEFLPGLREEAK